MKYAFVLQNFVIFTFSFQVRIFFDQDSEQLLVTIMQAIELQPRAGGFLNPYVKMYLLPGSSKCICYDFASAVVIEKASTLRSIKHFA